MITNVIRLTLHDLAVVLRNKTVCLVLFAPLFILAVLRLVDLESPRDRVRIGLIEDGRYPATLVDSIESAERAFSLTRLANIDDGMRRLEDRTLDGVVVPAAQNPDAVSVWVLDQASLQTVAIIEGLTRLQRVIEGRSGSWVSEVHAVHRSAIGSQMMPTWMLMLVLLVSFIVLPAQVAEDKEKKLLLGLLQTPVREAEWLAAKVITGVSLIAVAAGILQISSASVAGWRTGIGYLAFMTIGAFCFSACGILVGFLCRSQASARTLGVSCYLPLLLPSSLADYSPTLGSAASWLPSQALYGPLRALSLDGASLSNFAPQGLVLVGLGLTSLWLSYRLIKARWLM